MPISKLGNELTYVPILDVIEVAPFFEERSCQ